MTDQSDDMKTVLQMSTSDFEDLRKSNLPKYRAMLKSYLKLYEPANIEQLAMSIFKRGTDERNEDEIQILQQWTEHFKFFQELNSKQSNVNLKLHRKCCTRMKYERVTKGTVVFNAGDLPEKFYIVLSGAVNVMLPKSKEQINSDISEEKQKNKYLKSNDLKKTTANRIIAIKDRREAIRLQKEQQNSIGSSPSNGNPFTKRNHFDFSRYSIFSPGGSSRTSGFHSPSAAAGGGLYASSRNNAVGMSAFGGSPMHAINKPTRDSGTFSNMDQHQTLNSRQSICSEKGEVKPGSATSRNMSNTHSPREESVLISKEIIEDVPETDWESDPLYALLGSIPLDLISNLDALFADGVLKYKYLLSIKSGSMFGELGLLLKKPRAATIIAQADTEFAVLDADDYSSILSAGEMRLMNQRINFFSEYFLQGCGREVVTKYSYNFQCQKFVRGNYIYTQGEQSDNVYIIKKGLIEISHNIQMKQQEEDGDRYAKKISKQANVRLSTLTVGSCFGEIEIVKSTKRITHAICESVKATLWVLPAHIFMKLISENKFLVDSFLKQIKLKESWYHRQEESFNVSESIMTPKISSTPSVSRKYDHSSEEQLETHKKELKKDIEAIDELKQQGASDLVRLKEIMKTVEFDSVRKQLQFRSLQKHINDANHQENSPKNSLNPDPSSSPFAQEVFQTMRKIQQLKAKANEKSKIGVVHNNNTNNQSTNEASSLPILDIKHKLNLSLFKPREVIFKSQSRNSLLIPMTDSVKGESDETDINEPNELQRHFSNVSIKHNGLRRGTWLDAMQNSASPKNSSGKSMNSSRLLSQFSPAVAALTSLSNRNESSEYFPEQIPLKLSEDNCDEEEEVCLDNSTKKKSENTAANPLRKFLMSDSKSTSLFSRKSSLAHQTSRNSVFMETSATAVTAVTEAREQPRREILEFDRQLNIEQQSKSSRKASGERKPLHPVNTQSTFLSVSPFFFTRSQQNSSLSKISAMAAAASSTTQTPQSAFMKQSASSYQQYSAGGIKIDYHQQRNKSQELEPRFKVEEHIRKHEQSKKFSLGQHHKSVVDIYSQVVGEKQLFQNSSNTSCRDTEVRSKAAVSSEKAYPFQKDKDEFSVKSKQIAFRNTKKLSKTQIEPIKSQNGFFFRGNNTSTNNNNNNNSSKPFLPKVQVPNQQNMLDRSCFTDLQIEGNQRYSIISPKIDTDSDSDQEIKDLAGCQNNQLASSLTESEVASAFLPEAKPITPLIKANSDLQITGTELNAIKKAKEQTLLTMVPMEGGNDDMFKETSTDPRLVLNWMQNIRFRGKQSKIFLPKESELKERKIKLMKKQLNDYRHIPDGNNTPATHSSVKHRQLSRQSSQKDPPSRALTDPQTDQQNDSVPEQRQQQVPVVSAVSEIRRKAETNWQDIQLVYSQKTFCKTKHNLFRMRPEKLFLLHNSVNYQGKSPSLQSNSSTISRSDGVSLFAFELPE